MPSKAQQKGYRSNSKAVEWLLEHGFTWVWLHPHPRHPDRIRVSKTLSVMSRDIFGLFDGICIDSKGSIIFIQVKTNSWDGLKNIQQWSANREVKSVFINVVDGKGVQVKFINYSSS